MQIIRSDDPRVTLEWLKQGLRDDPLFPREALEVLKSVDPQSTHTIATSAEALVEWWLVEGELRCYERGEVVLDTTAVTLYADQAGSLGAAERAIELAWKVDRAEFVLLLASHALHIPEFLRLKTPPPTHEGPNWMGYTVEEAALEVANHWEVNQAELEDRIHEAGDRGELEFLDPTTGLPYKPKTRRDFYERISAAGLNAWFEEKGVPYHVGGSQQPTPPDGINSVASDDVQSVDRRQVMETFLVRPDRIQNISYWDDKLSRPPNWLRGARVSLGRPGLSSRWNPLLVAHAVLSHGDMTIRQLDAAIHQHRPEILKRWKEETEDHR